MPAIAVKKNFIYMCENSAFPLWEECKKKLKNAEIKKIPCAGRIEKDIILDQLNAGIEKVIVFSCFEGACNYVHGNVKCHNRIKDLQSDLKELGMDQSIVQFNPVTANMQKEFEIMINEINKA